MTEEAEADLANNNDPNNNSSTNANEDYANDQVTSGPANPILLASSATTPSSATTAAEGDQSSQSSSFIENLYFGTGADNADAVDETDSVLEAEDPFQAALERDISLILKLMPDKAYDEVRCMLESHQENPSRVQVWQILMGFISISEIVLKPLKAWK